MRCCAAHLPTPPRLGTRPHHPRLAHPRTRTKSTRHRARRRAQPDRSRYGGRRGGGAVRAGGESDWHTRARARRARGTEHGGTRIPTARATGVAGRRGGARRDRKRKAEPEAKAAYSPTPPATGTPAHAHEEHAALAQSHAYSSAHASQRFPAPARIFARRGRGVVSGSGSEDGAVRAQEKGTGRHIGSIKHAEAKNRRREGKVCSRPHAPERCTPCRPFVALDAESRIRKSKRACALRT